MWAMARSRMARAPVAAAEGRIGYTRRIASRPASLVPYTALTSTHSPSRRVTRPTSAPHSLTALSAMMSKTGWRSVGELLMTRRISLVAVCCSSDSLRSWLRASNSVNRRTFSMAITAWSAKVLSSSTSLSENRPGVARATMMTPTGVPSRIMGT